MTTLTLPYLLKALSPLHIGTGRSLDLIDAPISREASNGLPNAPGSGIKGVVRDALQNAYYQKDQAKDFFHDFGGDRASPESGRHQGAISFSDAYLLALPVHSQRGGFAWVTSPYLLARLHRWTGWLQDEPVPTCTNEACVLTSNSALVAGRDGNESRRVLLHDLELTAASSQDLTAGWSAIGQQLAAKLWPNHSADQNNFCTHFALISDVNLAHLSHVATDVRDRIRIDSESGAVADGAYWSEETLPSETLLWGTVLVDPLRDVTASDVEKRLQQHFGPERVLHLGGKTTIGHGLTQMSLASV